MKLLTKEIEKKIPALHSQKFSGDGLNQEFGYDDLRFVCKFFDPIGSWTWYVLEGDKGEDGDWLFYGFVEGIEKEWGYFRLSELESIATKSSLHAALQLGIERDIYYSPQPVANFV